MDGGEGSVAERRLSERGGGLRRGLLAAECPPGGKKWNNFKKAMVPCEEMGGGGGGGGGGGEGSGGGKGDGGGHGGKVRIQLASDY